VLVEGVILFKWDLDRVQVEHKVRYPVHLDVLQVEQVRLAVIEGKQRLFVSLHDP